MIFFAIFALIIPAIMVAGGICMLKHPPKKINGLIGYRTVRSMKNKDTWQFAHAACGRLWVKYGLGLLLICAAVCVAAIWLGEDVRARVLIGLIGVQMMGLLFPIFEVERQLKDTFDEDGERK